MIVRKLEEQEFYLPEIQRRKLRRRRKIIIGIIFLSIYFLVLGFLRVVFWTPIFQIKNFEIEGIADISKENLINFLRWQVMDAGWKHILGFDNILVWPDFLQPDKLGYLPALKGLEISKNYRERTLGILVSERSPFGVWCLSKSEVPECFWFDEEGTFLSPAPFIEGSLIPVITDASRDKIVMGSRILSQNQISNLFSILRVLAASKIRVKEIRLEDAALSEVKVLTYDGPELYFSLRFPADNYLAILDSFRNATGVSGLEKLKYIDFRVENRAYYK